MHAAKSQPSLPASYSYATRINQLGLAAVIATLLSQQVMKLLRFKEKKKEHTTMHIEYTSMPAYQRSTAVKELSAHVHLILRRDSHRVLTGNTAAVQLQHAT